MNGAAVCSLLAACLGDDRDRAPRLLGHVRGDWKTVARIASASLVSPAFLTALERNDLARRVPDDFFEYLGALRELNTERNETFLAELQLVIAALNRAGITPGLLKGCASVVSGLYAHPGERVLGDLDLVVTSDEMPRAIEALTAEGYRVASDRSEHAQALVHPQRRAAVDLHTRMVSTQRGYDALEGVRKRIGTAWKKVDHRGAACRIPDPTLQLAHRFVHDMIHEPGYARGWITLRGMHDAFVLGRDPDIRWDALATLSGGDVRAEWQVFGYAMRRLFPKAPGFEGGGFNAWLWYLRLRAQQRWPSVYAVTRNVFRKVRHLLPARWMREHGYKTDRIGEK